MVTCQGRGFVYEVIVEGPSEVNPRVYSSKPNPKVPSVELNLEVSSSAYPLQLQWTILKEVVKLIEELTFNLLMVGLVVEFCFIFTKNFSFVTWTF